MKHIFLMQMQSLIKDVRFGIFFVILMLSVICSSFISSEKYESMRSREQFMKNKYESELQKNAKISLERIIWMDHIAVQKTSPLLFLAGSNSIDYPNFSRIQPVNLYFGYLREISRDNYYPQKSLGTGIDLGRFIRYDMSFLVEVLFSLMVIILTYNIISKEVESGTLQLLLSNPIPRHQVLLGKILANSLVVSISLACGMILQIAIVQLLGKIPLDNRLFIIVPLLFIVSFLYLLFWIVLSTLFSVVARNSNISLTILMAKL